MASTKKRTRKKLAGRSERARSSGTARKPRAATPLEERPKKTPRKKKRTRTPRTPPAPRPTAPRRKTPKKTAGRTHARRPVTRRRALRRQAAAPRIRARGAAPVSAATELTQTFVDAALKVEFSDAASIDKFYADRFNKAFVDWYHDTVDSTQPNDAQVKTRFAAFWNRFPEILGGPISLLQQVTLHEVFRKEGNGDMRPRGEKVGSKGHKGIAYLFDRIAGIKRSYNTAPGNRTALHLFNDAEFLSAHEKLPLGERLGRTQDAIWKGDAYPQATTPTDDDHAVAGFVLEADFSKFRGRGLIQTTLRSNYAKLIAFIQGYQGTNTVVREFRDAWKGAKVDAVASRSRLADWKRLFEESDYEVPAQAIRMHNEDSGRYLDLGKTSAVLNGKGSGSVFNVGKRINGGSGYAADLKTRVVKVCNALGN